MVSNSHFRGEEHILDGGEVGGCMDNKRRRLDVWTTSLFSQVGGGKRTKMGIFKKLLQNGRGRRDGCAPPLNPPEIVLIQAFYRVSPKEHHMHVTTLMSTK